MLSPQGHRITRLFPGIHYAWIIIVIAGIMHMAGGSVRQAFGVLVVPLQQDMGWSPASISLGYALGSIVGAALARWLPRAMPTTDLSYLHLLGSLWTLVRKHSVLRRVVAVQFLIFAAFISFWSNLALLMAEPQHELGVLISTRN